MEIQEEYLSIKEFAAMMHMHYNTIMRAVKNGRIQSIRISCSKKAAHRIPRSEANRLGILELDKLIEKKVEERIQNEKGKKWTGLKF